MAQDTFLGFEAIHEFERKWFSRNWGHMNLVHVSGQSTADWNRALVKN